MRDSLLGLLNDQPEFVVCGYADSAHLALSEMPKVEPDLVIVDLSLKEGSGLDLVKLARAQNPGLHILVLSMHDERFYAERCIRSGAQGYVMKSEPAVTILNSIRRILSGRISVSETVASALAERILAGRKGGDGSLSEEFSNREMEVFDLLGQGLGARQIAESLNISTKTVQTYFWRIRQKLHLISATELVRRAALWHNQHINEKTS